MDNSTYLQASVAAYDSRATIYWLFELLFRSVKSKSESMGLYTNSHYETQTVGLDLLHKNGLLTKEDIHLYGVVRDMFLLSEYDGKQYAWEKVAPLVAQVEAVCRKLA